VEVFVCILALAFSQIWGFQNPLHRDEWLQVWQDKCNYFNFKNEALYQFILIAFPVAILFILVWLLSALSTWLLLPVSVVFVVYSLGRTDAFDTLGAYLQACYFNDWHAALSKASLLKVDTGDIEEDNWLVLHQRVFKQATYFGYERRFSVFFWFFILGPVGAVMYRLVSLLAVLSGKYQMTRACLRCY